MFTEKTMKKLADVLQDIIACTDGNWKDRASFISWKDRASFIKSDMEERGADGALEEFVSWFQAE